MIQSVGRGAQILAVEKIVTPGIIETICCPLGPMKGCGIHCPGGPPITLGGMPPHLRSPQVRGPPRRTRRQGAPHAGRHGQRASPWVVLHVLRMLAVQLRRVHGARAVRAA